jgi:hypothetical protein
MDERITLGELVVVVLAQNHNPSILNPDFLRHNAIVPTDWALQGDPVTLPPFAQVEFARGLTISADLNRLQVAEALVDKPLEQVSAPEVARRYVEALPHVDYRAVGLNPRGHFLADSSDEAERFVADRLLSRGPWSNFNDSPAIAAVSLRYALAEGSSLAVSLQPGALSVTDEPGTSDRPALFVTGNFHYDLRGDAQGRIATLLDVLNRWRADLDAYAELAQRIVV